MTYVLDQFVDDIAKRAADKVVIVGPEHEGTIPVFYYGGGDQIDEATIRFEFATDVSRKHRNVTTGVKTLATFLVLRGLRVAIVAHPDSLGEAFMDFWPHLAQFEHPAHKTV